MKYFIALLFPAVAMANPTLETCKAYGDMAQHYAEARYRGASMEELVENVRPGDDEKMAQYLIIKAYGLPPVISEGTQSEVVRDFRNNVFRQCYTHVYNADNRQP